MTNQTLDLSELKNISLIGTHIPRRCGIGTFTNDLADALEDAAPEVQFHAVAMDDRPEGYRYPPRVWFEINQPRLGEHRLAADFLNLAKTDLVCVQHEYGIFGGPDGGYLIELLRRLNMPVVTTMHTVLKEPTDGQREVTERLAEVSDRIVVLSHRAVEFLTEIYKLPPEKIIFIPHGIPEVSFIDPNYYKDQFGVEGRKVILTFGLLSPGKGIEGMIEAMPSIVKENPEAVYIVLGATHPAVRAQQGESYRSGLVQRIEELGLTDHVIFHNKFVELEELCEFLGAADVYVTPYLNEAQIVSGTLAYALGAGKATVSTPYWYAEEMLADGRGIIVPFKDSQAMAREINGLFAEEVKRHAMRKNAYTFTRSMLWRNVAQQYLEVFTQVVKERHSMPRPLAATPHKQLRGLRGTELPEINIDHLRNMTDDCGILQHAKATIANRHHGYCVDDNCRALIVVLMAQDYAKEEAALSWLTKRYLGFLHYAFNEDTGRFRNFMSYDRQWLEAQGSQDSHARSLWALGEAVARVQSRGHLAVAIDLFHRALPAAEKFDAPRSWAYTLIGIHAYLRRFSGDANARRIRETLSKNLLGKFTANATNDWPWLEDIVTYANARLPHALLLSGKWMFDDQMIEMGLRSLKWLWDIQKVDGHFSPVGCDGWYPKDGEKAHFDQQPIEACGMVDACMEAYHVTQDEKWVDRAQRCLNWYLGDNDVRAPLYDYNTGGCFDGLHPQGVNVNQGAESTLCWLLSLLTMYENAHDSVINERRTAKDADIVISEQVRRTQAPDRPKTKSGKRRPAGQVSKN